MTYSRLADWLTSDDKQIFFWHHYPVRQSNNTAIIIVGPIGPEYMHCFRSIKQLADTLAQSGFHCIRYDPIGMGNSSGSLEDEHLWAKWVNSPVKFTEYFHNHHNIKNIIMIGLRSGCLVLAEALQKQPVKAAVFWYPYTRGAAYIRDIKILDSMLYNNKNFSAQQILDGGGYPITVELQTKINTVNLLSQDYSSVANTLVINSKETASQSGFYDVIKSSGNRAESACLEGLDAMTKQAAISVTPYSNIEYITSWVNKLNSSELQACKEPTATEPTYHHSEFTEQTITIQRQHNIFGILTMPTTASCEKLVIIVNSGAAHHVGPNRFHVDTARVLARNNIATLRMDISNLGDSTDCYDQSEHHPYPRQAAQDINTAIEHMTENGDFKDIILCGLCSGAHNIFHAALNSNTMAIKKIILINPLTFYWKEGQSIFAPENHQAEIEEVYYQKQMFDYKKWAQLLVNPQKMYNILRFILLFSFKKITTLLDKARIKLHLKPATELEKDLGFLFKKEIKIALIYSKDDPGQKIIMSQAANIINIYRKKGLYTSAQIDNADHTFSSMQSRLQLLNALITNVTNKQ